MRDHAGRWYSLRTRPYLTLDNKVDGALVRLVDITALKEAEQHITEARDFAQSVVESVPPLLIFSGDLRVQAANESFYHAFRVTPAVTEHRLIYELGNGQSDVPELRRLLEEILPQDNRFKHYEITRELRGRRRTMLLSGCRMQEPAEHRPVHRGHHGAQAGRRGPAPGQGGAGPVTPPSSRSFPTRLPTICGRRCARCRPLPACSEEQITAGQDAQSADWSRRIKVAAARLDELVRDSLDYSQILRQELPLQAVNVAGLLRGILETYPNLQGPAVEIKLELEQLRGARQSGGPHPGFSNLLGNAVSSSDPASGRACASGPNRPQAGSRQPASRPRAASKLRPRWALPAPSLPGSASAWKTTALASRQPRTRRSLRCFTGCTARANTPAPASGSPSWPKPSSAWAASRLGVGTRTGQLILD